MFIQAQGIVLQSLSYSDSSLVVKIFTDVLGLRSYLVRAAKNKKSKMKPAVFQPLSVLNLVISQNKKPGLQSIKEITGCFVVRQDVAKNAVAMFMAEILAKTIREEEENKSLFDFVHRAVISLDASTGNVSCFHHWFMMALTRHLGFYPQLNYSAKNNVFNLYEGHFQENIPEHSYYLEKQDSQFFYEITTADHANGLISDANKKQRKCLLDKIIDYYKIHLNGFTHLNSHTVLEEVFR